MIKSLHIHNFGSNKKVDIKLDRHVTCITGESYTGKSWILRALKCISLNQPTGIRYIKWGTKKSTVAVHIGKHNIKRERSKTTNKYFVDGRKMEAFGSGKVPDSISRLFNITNINFQKQQEMPHGEGPLFWFALTPGQVSKHLNRIVNLDLIDRILYNLQSESRSAKSILVVYRTRRKEAKQRVSELAFVTHIKQEWSIICNLNKKADKYEAQTDTLKRLVDEITKQQSFVDEMKEDIENIEQDLQELEKLCTTIIYIEEQTDGLSEAILNTEQAKKDLSESQSNLKMAEQEYKKAFGERCPLCLKPIKEK